MVKKPSHYIAPGEDLIEEAQIPFPVERPEDTNFINTIIYGDTGAGKTYLLGTALDYEPTSPFLILDVDGGSKTLRGKGVDMVRPSSWKEIQDIYNFFRHDNHYYRALGIDSLTELQKKYSLGAILGDLKDVDDYADLGSTVVPTRQDWLKTGDQMRKFLRAFKWLSYIKDGGDRIHVFMTCLERIDEKRNIIGPSFSGQLVSESGAYVDVLARLACLSVEEEGEGGNAVTVNKRHLLVDSYTNEDGVRYLAKNRGSGVRQIWEPTIQKVVEMK